MRISPKSPQEQFRLITECRQSGLSDSQWCLQNGIKSTTFYNWVSRLRKKGVSLPVTSNEKPAIRQDIVKLVPVSNKGDLIVEEKTGEISSNATEVVNQNEVKCSQPVMELSFGSEMSLKISNNINPALLITLIQALKEQSC